MTDADTILKMIEAVDPTDTAKLDAINARFFEWSRLHSNKGNWDVTRSRDALKAIRPYGWRFEVMSGIAGTPFWASYEKPRPQPDGTIFRGLNDAEFFGNAFLTEELAELYAIIQAIEHDRRQHADLNAHGMAGIAGITGEGRG